VTAQIISPAFTTIQVQERDQHNSSDRRSGRPLFEIFLNVDRTIDLIAVLNVSGLSQSTETIVDR
jgi:hypothetical protein